MTEITTTDGTSLPALIDRASRMLDSARSSAEVLEVRDLAQVAWEAAKSAARMARAKKAHDDILAAAYRLQGDALAIQSRAKMRLADEYDAAQERGEIAKQGAHVAEYNMTATADLGLRRDEIHEARQLRDAERAAPGVIESTIYEQVAAGEEPTKAAINQAVEAVNKPHVAQNSGNNEWYTPEQYIDSARRVLGTIDLDPASSDVANRTVKASKIFTADDDGLSQEWPVGTIWMNPPYAQPLMGQFADRFASEVRRGSSGVVLVNNATETAWFQTIALECSAICFPRSRIKFLDPDGNASGAPLQGQAIIYCGPRPSVFRDEFCKYGLIVNHGGL